MGTPSSQKPDARPVLFTLDDKATGKPSVSVNFYVRPEDLSRTDPSRLNVHQTLGNDTPAWIDNFGVGIRKIQISGHTGWRRSPDGPSQKDGLERFEELHTTVFKEWHARRELAIRLGKDPDRIELIFTDGLDNTTDVVVPEQFVLKRSKSRPLLAQYQISMTAVKSEIGFKSNNRFPPDLGGSALSKLGLESITDSINSITRVAGEINATLNAEILGPIKEFNDMAIGVMQTAQQAVGEIVSSFNGVVDAVAGPILATATSVAQAAISAHRTLASILAVPQAVKAKFMSLAGSFNNIKCVLRNVFRRGLRFPDYTDLYGSSTCSSTSGGRGLSPLRNENPFFKMVTNPNIPVVFPSAAKNSLDRLMMIDPVLNVPTVSGVLNEMRSAATGVVTTVLNTATSNSDAVMTA